MFEILFFPRVSKNLEKRKIEIKNKAVSNNKQKVCVNSKRPSSSSTRQIVAATPIRRRSNRDASKNASLINSFIIDDVYGLEKKKSVAFYFFNALTNSTQILFTNNSTTSFSQQLNYSF